MIIIVNILGFLFLLLLFLLAILLLSPLKYRFDLTYKENLTASFSAKIMPLFNLQLSFQDYRPAIILRILGIKTNIREGKEGGTTKEKELKKDGLPFSLKLATKENFRHFLELLQDIYQILRPQELRIWGRAGLSEPHHTAWLLAGVSILPARLQRAIHFEPVWDEEFIETDIYAAGNIILGQALVRALRFLFSKKTRLMWREMRQQKKLRKHAT